MDAESNRAFVLLSDPVSVLRIDLATGDRVVLSDATTPAQPGGGPLLQAVSGLAYDASGDRLILHDQLLDRLLAIDSLSGIRTVLSADAGGVSIRTNMRLVVDNTRGAAFGVVVASSSVVQFSLADGERTLIAGPADDRGYVAESNQDLVVDGGRLLVSTEDTVFELDLVTLQRRRVAVLSSAERNRAQSWAYAGRDPVTGDLLHVDYFAGMIIRTQLELDDSEHVLSGALYGDGPILSPEALAVVDDAIYVADSSSDSVARIDLETGDRTIISSETRGAGLQLMAPHSISTQMEHSRLFVMDDGRLIAVDIESGDRTLISTATAPAVGSGPGFASDSDIAPFIDTANNRAVISSVGRVLGVDLTSGDRTELSGPSRGTGYLPTAFRSLEYVPPLFYATCNADEIVAIDPNDGDRWVISGESIDSPGPSFTNAGALAFDSINHALIVQDRDEQSFVTVSIANGERRNLQDASGSDIAVAKDRILYSHSNMVVWKELVAHAQEVEYTAPARGVLPTLGAFDMSEERFCGLEQPPVVLACIDLATAEVTTWPDTSDPPLVPWSSFIDSEHRKYYLTTIAVFGAGQPTIVSYDLASGEHSIASGPMQGSGPPLSMAIDGAIDEVRDRLLVLDATLPALLVVDPSTGDRHNLSGGPEGEGIAWVKPVALAYDAALDRALVVDAPGLIAVDLENGNRTLVSGEGEGDGLVPEKLFGIVLDGARNRALVRDLELGLMAIDLRSGDREVLAERAGEPNTEGTFLTAFGKLVYDASRRTVLYTDILTQSTAALMELDEVSGDSTVLLGRAH